MINLNEKVINDCDKCIVELSCFLDKVYEITFNNTDEKVKKLYIEEFGVLLEEVVKKIRKSEHLNKIIFGNEKDLKFALKSFEESFQAKDYEMCSYILKYEFKYILYKWQRKIKIEG